MNESELAILIRDMAAEFVTARLNTPEYVSKRHAWMNDKQRAAKEQQVNQRKAQAERIHALSGEIAEFILKTEAAKNGGA